MSTMAERKLPLEKVLLNQEEVYQIHEMHSVNDVLRFLVTQLGDDKEEAYRELVYLTTHLDYE